MVPTAPATTRVTTSPNTKTNAFTGQPSRRSMATSVNAPNARIDGTHRPTKTPVSFSPVNHRVTESRNDAKAAAKIDSAADWWRIMVGLRRRGPGRPCDSRSQQRTDLLGDGVELVAGVRGRPQVDLLGAGVGERADLLGALLGRAEGAAGDHVLGRAPERGCEVLADDGLGRA